MNFKQRINAIQEKGKELNAKAEAGTFTLRDLDELVEANAKLQDVFEEMENADTLDIAPEPVTIRVDGVTIKFRDADHLAEYLSGVMNNATI